MGRSRPLLLAASLTFAGLAGCASAPIDPAAAVRVRLSNRSPMKVWVEFSRSSGGARWIAPAPAHRDVTYLVRHRAFGDGPIRLHLIRWPGALHLTSVYVHDGEGDFRVEPGSVILVRVEERLQDSRVLVGNSVERIVLGRGLRPLPGEFRKRP